MKNFTKLLAGFLLGIIAIGAMAATISERVNYDNGATLSRNAIGVEVLTVDTSATIPALAVATSITNNGIDVRPPTGVSLTSPSVTTTAAGATVLSVTTDVTQTGLIINGGTTGQVLIVRGTSDSNTIRLDDGTSYTLAGNAVLGLGDSVTLWCVDAGVAISAWEELSRSLN